MDDKKKENIETLKEIIVKSTEWMDNKEWEWAARYDDLYDAFFGVQISAAICLYHELHLDSDTSAEGYQMAVYDVIEEVLAENNTKGEKV